MDENKIAHYEALIGVNLETYLRREYSDNCRTDSEISEISGIPSSMVSKYRKYFGIQPRTKAETEAMKRKILSDKLCAYCNEPIPLYRKEKETCSGVCARKYGVILRHEESNKQTHYCELCGASVPENRKSKRFCSNNCAVKWGHVNNPRPNSGNGVEERACTVCGAKFYIYRYKLRTEGVGTFCSRKCFNEYRRSDVSLEHIKEATLEIYNTTEVLPTKEILAHYLGTTRKVIENRAGSITNLYCSMGLSTARIANSTGRTARILFARVDEIYKVRGVREVTFHGLRNPLTRRKLLLDYFLDSAHLAVEYQGAQHFSSKMFRGFSETAETEFNHSQTRDQAKRDYCSSNGIVLVEWNYFTPISDENIHKYLDPIIKEGVRVPTLIKTE